MSDYHAAYTSLVRAAEEVLKVWDQWRQPGSRPGSRLAAALESLRRELPDTGTEKGTGDGADKA